MIIEKLSDIPNKYIKEDIVYVKNINIESFTLLGDIKALFFQSCNIKHVKAVAEKLTVYESVMGNLYCSCTELCIKKSTIINIKDNFLIGFKNQFIHLMDSDIEFINTAGIHKKKFLLDNVNIDRFIIHSCSQNGVMGIESENSSRIDSLIIYSTISIYFLMYSVNVFNLKVIGNVITGPYNKLIQNLYDI